MNMGHPADDPASFNRRVWDNIAAAGNRWFKATTTEEIRAAARDEWTLKVTPTMNVPREWFGDLCQQRVLCLAGGGGQQAPLMAAAGAHVTVVDNSERQLERDRQIADEHQLPLSCVQADMRDLSPFGDQTFDLIFNPTSVCYVEAVTVIWQECYRCLKPGGRLISGLINPLHYLFDPIARDKNELIVRHQIPYSDLQLSDEEQSRILGETRPIEYGHPLGDLLGGLLAAGLELTGFYTDRWGDDDRLSDHIDVFVAVCCRRPIR